MKASKTIKMIMVDKGVTVNDLAERTGKSAPTINNTFYNDRHSTKGGMTLSIAAEYAEALGCEIVFRDKETGKIY